MSVIISVPSPNLWVFTGLQIVIGFELVCRPNIVCRSTRYLERVPMDDPENDLFAVKFNLPEYFADASSHTYKALSYAYLLELPSWNATVAESFAAEPCLNLVFYNNFDSRNATTENFFFTNDIPPQQQSEYSQQPKLCGRYVPLEIPVIQGKLQYELQCKAWSKTYAEQYGRR